MATRNKTKPQAAGRALHLIAKELGVSSKELMEQIEGWDLGWTVKSHMNKVSEEQEAELVARFGGEKPKKAAKKPAKKKPAKKKADDDATAEAEEKPKKAVKKPAKKKPAKKKADDDATAEAEEKPKKAKKPTKPRAAKKSADEHGDGGRKVRAMSDLVADGREWLTDTLNRMGLERSRVTGTGSGRKIDFNITGPGTEALLGPANARARTGVVESLQTLMSRTVFNSERDLTIIVDVNGFRAGRDTGLQAAAQRVAEFARFSNTKVRFAAMNAFDRRAIHLALRSEDDVLSESQGYGALRRLEVWTKNAQAAYDARRNQEPDEAGEGDDRDDRDDRGGERDDRGSDGGRRGGRGGGGGRRGGRGGGGGGRRRGGRGD